MKLKFKILLIPLALISVSCLEDPIVPVPEFQIDDGAKILQMIEEHGDFANSSEAPSLILASELFNNLNNYFVVDVREPNDFIYGHISTAINVTSTKLLSVVDSLSRYFPAKKIVIVSKNGQASAYFTCLLRLAGYQQVYSLNFGMASWNIDFASEWFDALGNAPDLYSYSNYEWPLDPITALPLLQFPAELGSTEEKYIYKIKQLISQGFTSDLYETQLDESVRDKHYVICFGIASLYGAHKDYGFLGHPENTVWYKPADFRSMNNLQRLPADGPILIYTIDGQLSACMAAQLRLLGYNAKTLLFGYHQLFYSRIIGWPDLIDSAFSIADVMNYPYSSGN